MKYLKSLPNGNISAYHEGLAEAHPDRFVEVEFPNGVNPHDPKFLSASDKGQPTEAQLSAAAQAAADAEAEDTKLAQEAAEFDAKVEAAVAAKLDAAIAAAVANAAPAAEAEQTATDAAPEFVSSKKK